MCVCVCVCVCVVGKGCQNKNQNCLEVIRPKTLAREVNLATESSAYSEAEVRKSVREFQSLIVWGNWTCKCQILPKGFEMPGNDDLVRKFGEQGHLWVYWLQPSDLCKASLVRVGRKTLRN